MSYEVLFISPGKTTPRLAEVAKQVFHLLALSEWEERFSSNYPPDEHYFAGYAKNADVKISDSDDDRMPDYPFYILIRTPSWRRGADTIVIDPPTVAKLLAADGFIVFIPTGDWARTDWNGDGDVYTA